MTILILSTLFNVVAGSILLVTIDRVGSQETTTIQAANLDRRTAILYNIDSDFTIDGTGSVVTAENLIVLSVGNSQVNVAVDVGLVRPAKLSTTIFYTVEQNVNGRIGIGRFTSTV